MMNWKLFALGTMAAGAMMISSAACSASSSSGSDTTGGGGDAGAAGSGAAGAAAGAAGAAAGGAAGAGGSGSSVDTTIIGAFEDPMSPACHDCLKGMTGNLMLMMGSVDCGTVAAMCGAADEKCGTVVTCIDAYQKAHPMDKLDCAVDKCLDMAPEPNDFFNCAADRCGTACGLTVGFTTTGCGMLFRTTALMAVEGRAEATPSALRSFCARARPHAPIRAKLSR